MIKLQSQQSGSSSGESSQSQVLHAQCTWSQQDLLLSAIVPAFSCITRISCHITTPYDTERAIVSVTTVGESSQELWSQSEIIVSTEAMYEQFEPLSLQNSNDLQLHVYVTAQAVTQGVCHVYITYQKDTLSVTNS